MVKEMGLQIQIICVILKLAGVTLGHQILNCMWKIIKGIISTSV